MNRSTQPSKTMIKQKKATDRAIYMRYKDMSREELARCGMLNFIQWYNRGKKPKFEASDAHWKARALIIELCKTMRQDEICKTYGLYNSFIYRLKTKDFQRVPEERCKQFINEYEQSKL